MANTNVQEFRAGIAGFVDEARVDHETLTRALALRGLSDLVLGTRVDTGRARGNWQVGEGEPPEGFDPENFDETGTDTISAGSQEIANASGQDIIWIQNGVPYIAYLEDGPYVQDHMLEGAYEALVSYLEGLG